MKKSFGAYVIGWLAVLGLFNLIAFIVPGENKYDTLFWVGYGLITATFIGQLICTHFVFNADSLQKTFYNISLYSLSINALIVMLVAGGLCMAVDGIPTWLGVIVCAAVLVIYIVAVAKAAVAVDAVAQIDKKIKVKTVFIKMLTADAMTLTSKAAGTEMEAAAHKVYEAIRYSDPMSDDMLANVEQRMSQKFMELSGAVDAKDIALVNEYADQLVLLANERNNKCKVLK